MITLTGKKVSEGIVIGKLVFYKRDERENRRIYVKDVEKEVQRFQKARQKAMAELSLNEGYILTTEHSEEISFEGRNIHVLPIWKFILAW